MKAYWPGRMEEVFPGIYLDGAHNEDGIEAFLNSVKEIPCEGRRLLLFGVVQDKQYEKMIRQIASADLFSEVAVTVLETDRSASLEKLREIWGQYKICCFFLMFLSSLRRCAPCGARRRACAARGRSRSLCFLQRLRTHRLPRRPLSAGRGRCSGACIRHGTRSAPRAKPIQLHCPIIIVGWIWCV